MDSRQRVEATLENVLAVFEAVREGA